MLRLVIVIALVISLSGCLGIGVVFDSAKNESHMYDSKNETFETIRAKKGEPDKVIESSELVSWEYYKKSRKHRWSGVTLFLIIPIPIWLPEKLKEVYQFKNGQVVEHTDNSMAINLSMYGCFFALPFAGGTDLLSCAAGER
jgi:hypothetical protein